MRICSLEGALTFWQASFRGRGIPNSHTNNLYEIRQCLAEIKSWLERFCQKQQQGKLMRGLEMCKNAFKAAVGSDTSFEKLMDLNAHLESHISQLQGLELFGMGTKMNEVIWQQQQMMEQVNTLLETGMRPGGSGLDDHAVQQIGEAYGMVASDVRREVQLGNQALLERFTQQNTQQHDEVMDKLNSFEERMMDFIKEKIKAAAETSSQSIIEQLEYFPWSVDEWVRRGGYAEDDEEERSELGRGAFATTSRMRGKGGTKLDGHVVAVKKIDLKAALKNHGVTEDDMESEVQVLEGLKHPNVIKIIASHEDRKHLYIVLELAEGGSLGDFIKARPRPTVERMMKIMAQAINALVYIHQMRVQHRDIKPENILLSKGGNVKLTDFGLAKMSMSSAASMAETKVGTHNYFSPEKMHGVHYDGKDDVWALGVVFVELGMCTRLDGPIWYDDSEIRAKREGLIRSVASVSPQISAWVSQMLQVDQRQRCTAEQLMISMKSGPGNPQAAAAKKAGEEKARVDTAGLTHGRHQVPTMVPVSRPTMVPVSRPTMVPVPRFKVDTAGLTHGRVHTAGLTHGRVHTAGLTHGRVHTAGLTHGRVDTAGLTHGRVDTAGLTHGRVDTAGLTHGRREDKDGSVYEGDLKDGKRDGRGKHTFADGSVYEGDWKDNKENGRGKYTWADGSVYEGDWKDGKKDGRGKYTWADGNVYEGDWKDGKKDGRGKLTFADGNVYEGDWKDGKKDGRGKLTFADGSVYEGDWKDNKKDGRGKYTWANGTVWEGDWKDNKQRK